jgi:predicted membrane protein
VKIGCAFSGFFWGVFFVLLGAAVIVKAVYHINVPVFRIFLGLLIIAFGIQMLLGGAFRRKETIAFQEGALRANGNQKEYSVMFGKGAIDLSGVQIGEKSVRVDVSAVFGAATLRLSPDTPALIRASTAFGWVRMPDGNNASFGTYVYTTKSYRENAPHLVINSNVVFGSLDIGFTAS